MEKTDTEGEGTTRACTIATCALPRDWDLWPLDEDPLAIPDDCPTKREYLGFFLHTEICCDNQPCMYFDCSQPFFYKHNMSKQLNRI